MSGKRILIVSLENITTEKLFKSFEGQGVKLDLCNNVQTAYDKIEKSCFNLFLIDVQIPEIDLERFINRIYRRHNDPVIILITGCDFTITHRDHLGKAIFDYLFIPLNHDEVLHKINLALKFDDVLKENAVLKDKVIELDELFNLSDLEDESLASYEKRYILHVLNKNKWNISRSANLLKIDRVTLYNKINKYNLRTAVKVD